MVKTKFGAVLTRRLRGCAVSFVMSLCFNVHGASAGGGRTEPVTLRLDPYVILQQVARQMNVTLRPEVPLPKIFLESKTPLRQFQQAIRPQWKFRPHVFANAYAAERNEIYLSDDARYYKRRNRTLDDSLAHEFVHYIQVRYRNDNLEDDSCEMEAIDMQLSFIDNNAPAVVASGYGKASAVNSSRLPSLDISLL